MRRKKKTADSEEKRSKKPPEKVGLEEQLTLFAAFHKDPDGFRRRVKKMTFSNAKDGCGGNCIPCKKKKRCETYRNIKRCFTTG